MTEYARDNTKLVPQVNNILYITWNEPSFSHDYTATENFCLH